MCSAPRPKAPKIEEPAPLPPPEPLPTPQQTPMAPMIAPPQAPPSAPAAAPLPPMPQAPQTPPPPQMVQSQTSEDNAIVKRRKSKRKQLQQASKGAGALRIPLDKKIGSVPKGGTGTTGLNIPS